MKRILSIQSHVVFGCAGNSAAVFPMRRLGMEVWPVNTVQFSNHTQYVAGWQGMAMPAGHISALCQGLMDIEVLGRCDAVVATLPADESTFDMFDASRFAAMAAGTIFVNVSRGSLVVEGDLIEALRSGHLRAAVLDVTRLEPLPATDPLWDAPNLYLSPHTSTSLDRYVDNLVDLAADNLTRFVEGRPLRNEVDLTNR